MQDERDSRNQRWLRVHTTGLACLDYGGAGPPALLLHGLAGAALEWADTASWMAGTHHVLALDQRGHGRSERRPADVSPEAFLGDVVSVIDELDLGAVVLVGQSLGGHTAMLVAARHPEWVRALVVVEASPDATTPEEVETVRD